MVAPVHRFLPPLGGQTRSWPPQRISAPLLPLLFPMQGPREPTQESPRTLPALPVPGLSKLSPSQASQGEGLSYWVFFGLENSSEGAQAILTTAGSWSHERLHFTDCTRLPSRFNRGRKEMVRLSPYLYLVCLRSPPCEKAYTLWIV